MIRRRARNRKEVIYFLEPTSVKDLGHSGHLIMTFNFCEMSNRPMNIFQ